MPTPTSNTSFLLLFWSILTDHCSFASCLDHSVDLLSTGPTHACHQLRSIVGCVECAPRRSHALPHEPTRNHDPEGVHEHKVSPVVRRLRTRVRHVENVVIEHGRRIVQHVAVELAERDDELERPAQRMVVCDKNSGDEGARTPENLKARDVSSSTSLIEGECSLQQ
jgi:hypothetical protein